MNLYDDNQKQNTKKGVLINNGDIVGCSVESPTNT